jgi:hypothetical protein
MHNTTLNTLDDLLFLGLCTVPAQKQSTLVLLYPIVGLCMNFKKEQQLADQDTVHPHLKGAIGNSMGSDKYHILTIFILQLLWYKGLELVMVECPCL